MESADLTQLPAAPAVPLKARLLDAYTVIVIGGIIAGLVFGDRIFPEIDAILGDPQTDIAFGMLGGLLAAIAYDVAENMRNALEPGAAPEGWRRHRKRGRWVA